MHIVIEGMDGSGKTSTARLVAKELGWKYVQRPFHYFSDAPGSYPALPAEPYEIEEMPVYSAIAGRVNNMDYALRARFYGFGIYYVSELAKKHNLVIDRHVASFYYLYGEGSEDYFRQLVSDCETPDLTVVLFVDAEERKRRIAARNPLDEDLKRDLFDDRAYDRLIAFLKQYDMPYVWIDATALTLEEVAKEVLTAWEEKCQADKTVV